MKAAGLLILSDLFDFIVTSRDKHYCNRWVNKVKGKVVPCQLLTSQLLTLLRPLTIAHTTTAHSGKHQLPWQLPTGVLQPLSTAHPHTSPKLIIGQLPTYQRQLLTWQFPSDNCSPDNCSPDNCPHDNCSLTIAHTTIAHWQLPTQQLLTRQIRTQQGSPSAEYNWKRLTVINFNYSIR